MTNFFNHHFPADDQLGVIRLKISSLLKSTTLSNKETVLFTYLDAVFTLNLVIPTSKEVHLAEHIPGQETLDVIEEIVPGIVNPYVKVYLLDILQANRRKKFEYANQAIALYFSLIDQRAGLSEKRDFLLRVIQILKGLGKGNQSILLPNFRQIKAAVLAADILNECYSVTHIAIAMIELKADAVEYVELISLISDAATGSLSTANFKNYRECNHALALLVPEKSQEYGMEVAKGYIKEADEFSLVKNASQHIIADLYKKAYRIFKNFGLKTLEVDDLGRKLTKAQQEAVVQMSGNASLPTPIVTNPHLEFPQFDHVFQGIYWLASMFLPSKSAIQQQMEQLDKGALHRFFLGLSMSDGRGNTIGNSPDGEKQLYLDAKLTREIYCKSILIPMYHHFTESFAIAETELNAFLYHSYFIPPERLSIYTRGLYHGFCGNFVEAVHILVPQIENGLKTLVNKQGTITRKLNQDIQTEKNLQYFLGELKGVLNEDVLFDLDGLLNDAFGENLRHDLAHGLCETYRLESWLGLYTWWLALKLSLDLDRLMVNKQT